MTWTHKWLWRRHMTFLVLAFLGIQWMFSLWISPLTPQPFRAPKPMVVPETQNTFLELKFTLPRTASPKGISNAESSQRKIMKGNFSSSKTALNNKKPQMWITSGSYSKVSFSSTNDNQRKTSDSQNRVTFLHVKQQKLCDKNKLNQNGSCNKSGMDKESQVQISTDNSTDHMTNSSRLTSKTHDEKDAETLNTLRLRNGLREQDEKSPVTEELLIGHGGVKGEVNNHQELDKQQETIPSAPSSLANNQGIEKDTFERWKTMMDERKQRVREICSQYPEALKRFMNHNRLLFDTKHHIAYCRNAKAGTTSWLSDLLEGAGVSVDGMTSDEIHEAAKNTFPPLHPKIAAEEMDHPAFLFTVVRHPFTRLVSAYRDKMPENYRKDLQLQMIDKYRDKTDNKTQAYKGDATLLDPSVPTFREFALFVSDQILNCIPVMNSACLYQVDPHWRPYYDRCAPCDLHYNVIAKVETFHEDEKYIKLLSGLLTKSKMAKQNGSSHAHASTGPSSTNLTKIYFSQLTHAEQKNVFEAYFFDFQLFGYSPDIFN